MEIINNKQKAIQELRRISQRTTSGNNKKIDSIVEQILEDVKINGDRQPTSDPFGWRCCA